MKVRDLSEWQGQCATFASEGKDAIDFQRFVQAWADNAEAYMEREKDNNPVAALRNMLRYTEIQHGYADPQALGITLMLLASHWGAIESTEDFYRLLSPIEQHLYEETVNQWLLTQQRKAEEAARVAHS